VGRIAGSLLALVLGASALTTSGSAVAQEVDPAPETAPQLASLTVSGRGVGIAPAFAPTRRRFAVRTDASTRGITVTARTTSSGDALSIGGRPTSSGQPQTFSGLQAGEEITVQVAGAGGTRVYGLVYTPPRFPRANVTIRRPGIAPGRLFLGLIGAGTGGTGYLTVLDEYGVPLFVGVRPRPVYDFKPQPATGGYSYQQLATDTTATGTPNNDAVLLSPSMEELERFRTAPPLTSTNAHELLVLPNGNRMLFAYEPARHAGRLREDAVIQEVDENGVEVWRWNSWGHLPLRDNLDGDPVDYAHANSIEVDTDGNLLVSLRSMSAVVKINRQTGAVMWTLGGRSNDFRIIDPLGGFCGQHDARRLANGHLLMFDNGIDCAPDGADRNRSRAVEYAIDEQAMTARLVWSHEQPLYGFATGGTQRLANGNTLIGWGTAATITEVTRSGQRVFEMEPRNDAGLPFFSYRARRAPFPDAMEPRVQISTPAAGATFGQGQRVAARYACFDEGGSGVDTCDGSVAHRTPLDTSTLGDHVVTVTATDHAGNTRQLTRHYRVVPFRPDASIRRGATGRLVGNDVYNSSGAGQERVARIRPGDEVNYYVRVDNDGTVDDTIVLHGTTGDEQFGVRYFHGRREVSGMVKAGTYRLTDLAPGEQRTLRIAVRARRTALPGATNVLRFTATSAGDGAVADTVVARTKT
jgi:hypothetical protein